MIATLILVAVLAVLFLVAIVACALVLAGSDGKWDR